MESSATTVAIKKENETLEGASLAPLPVQHECSKHRVEYLNHLTRDDSYTAPPKISQSAILSLGFILFGVAHIYPPLILLVAYFLSVVITYSFRINDDATNRRQLIAQFEKEDPVSAKARQLSDDCVVKNSYWVNNRGSLLFTSVTTPKDQPIEAVVCFCHGYSDNPSYTRQKELAQLVRKGVAVVMIDYEGHGRSDGELCLITDWDSLVEDVSTYFHEVCKSRFPGKKVFLMGESMGGAVAYCIYERSSKLFSGVVFLCPMCKIADDMLPSQWIIDLCRKITGPSGSTTIFGMLPIAPTKSDLNNLTHKVVGKLALCTLSPHVLGRNPRLATARELLNATSQISKSLKDFDAPFIVQHGSDDRVTDPHLSRALYNESKSTDKTIRIYDGMWHSLLGGEPDENVEIVLKDSINWILSRTKGPDI